MEPRISAVRPPDPNSDAPVAAVSTSAALAASASTYQPAAALRARTNRS
ncbi:Uncharacterised protein [Mycobacterium tuberculosis]|uniref:Uncharacterized protein n=1 Tax=Mycobacterium tuberculosis TaxID=1773 RepID=A0A916PD87_MYCTX|nr:Uncharacterised protein [Mycobacterium tuberculosis]COY87801.1 Uncharacterised protein [Mycobacterium tuberculosis]CPA20350.1 Uncharacterised protein [Mycobacterium tuberculosis]